MNPSAEKYMYKRNNHTEGRSVLESLYELWINEDPAYDENVRRLYEQLGEWTDRLGRAESDRITGIVVDLCMAYSRKGFLDGARLGGLLLQEILLDK